MAKLPAQRLLDFSDVQLNFDALDTRDSAMDGRVTTLEARTWQAVVAALPGAPVDGQEIYFLADAANGVVWHLKYRAASASAFKWEFIGGAELRSEVPNSDTRANVAFGALTTAGPSVTVPLAGDYVVELEARASGSAAATAMLMSYDIGATAAVDGDALNIFSAAVNDTDNGFRSQRKANLAAAAALVAKYRATAGTGTWSNRVMRVTPIRVG